MENDLFLFEKRNLKTFGLKVLLFVDIAKRKSFCFALSMLYTFIFFKKV